MSHVIHACAEQDLPIIYGNLRRFNHSRIPFTQEEPFVSLSRKILDEDGNIIAGCIAEMYCWKVVFVDILWVDERYRHQGLGSRLLGAVEEAARAEGCTLIHLDSFSWQARDFYVKLGYEVFGVLEDCPEGQCRYFLKKKLTPTLDYVDLFNHIQPGFFQKDYIRALPPEHIFSEQVLRLADYSPTALTIDAPAHITYGVFTGDHAVLLEAVRAVDEDWAQWFQPDSRAFVAMDGNRVVSFCLLDDFGEYKGLKIGAPGCVGTVPEYRKQGIGLRMIQLATQVLKQDGYDLSWIHYTHVGHWYARLGYQTVVRWNCEGVVAK